MTRIKPSRTSKAAAAGGCTCFKLRGLTRRVTAVYDGALSAAGMRVTQYSLLAHLRGLRGVPMSQLAETLDMDRTTLTRNLKPLVEIGWVKVQPSEKDARIRLVRITASGEAQYRAARSHWRQAQDEISAMIGSSNLSGLHRMLDSYLPMFRPATGSDGYTE